MEQMEQFGTVFSEHQPPFVGPATFLRAPYAGTVDELNALKPDVAILGAPVDIGATNRPGARLGPRAIRHAGYFGAPNTDLYHIGLRVHPTRVLRIVDFGDAPCPPHSLEMAHAAVWTKVTQALQAGAVPIILGGDHSITQPAATAVAQQYGFGRVGVVHLDAHPDTGAFSYGPALLGHGTPMRRLIESGAVPGRNFVQVGLRGYWPPGRAFEWMSAHHMRWHTMAEIEDRGFDAVLDDAVAEACDGPDFTYLSIDVDVLDPAFAPGTGTPEPGGISSAELLRAVRRIASTVKLVAMDVVEVSPPFDGPGAITAEVAHRTVLEAVSALAWSRRQADTE